MPPRRGASSNSLSPNDPYAPGSVPSSSSASLAFPQSRSTSPSGFTQFLSKSSKWFTRRDSTSRVPSGGAEPRTSTTSSTTRKHKISQPTDPRPILNSDPYTGSSGVGSRSVLDVSQLQPSIDQSRSLGSPGASSFASGGSGDLRSISRKGWSRSADDLGKFTSPVSPTSSSFNAQITQYRGRSNSNSNAPAPSSASIGIAQPKRSQKQSFPTIVTSAPLSSSPPEDDAAISPMSASCVSISISGPDGESSAVPLTTAQKQAHARSQSFAPRLASKLSAPKISFSPSSPKRKGSAASEQELDRERDHQQREHEAITTPVSGSSSSRGFPFAFGGGSQKPLPQSNPNPSQSMHDLSASRGTALLSPPAVVEPQEGEDEDDRNTKRASQLLYHSGFINRRAESPPPSVYPYHTLPQPPAPTLAKGWKSFKLELKGSKLYFYKPPGDRAAAVKELFPTTLIPADLEDEAEAHAYGDASDNGRGRGPRRGSDRDDPATNRRKRAFWGRRTHPDLVHGDDGVERGNFEALVHETVFATTFLTEDSGTDDNRRRAEWKDFASAILLCLPSLVGAAKFETEFIRCCSYLVTGAEESTKDAERSRVAWLAREYIRCQGKPADGAAWDAWQAEIIPSLSVRKPSEEAPSAMSKTASMQALHAPSPLFDNTFSTGPDLSLLSPNVGTFSPRPEDSQSGNLSSLMDALNIPNPNATSQPASVHNKMLWTALEREGLSRDVLLMLDPRLVSQSLGVFHRSIFGRIPEDITGTILTAPEESSQADVADTSDLRASFGPLFGGEEHPHWLSKLILMQILGSDTSSGTLGTPLPGRTADQTSKTHSRSEVISAWGKIGELCRLAGDECSWHAIVSALCSRPIARLDKAWKRVDSVALSYVESWVFPGPSGECASVMEPRVTPWGGDARRRFKSALDNSTTEDAEDCWNVKSFLAGREIFEGIRTTFSLCSRKSDSGTPTGEDVERMVAFWRESSSEADNGRASKFTHVDHFMSLSYAAEPRRKGLFEPSYWSRSLPPGQPACHPLVPILFPEILPTLTLIERAQLWRGRLESTLTAPELQAVRTLTAQSQIFDKVHSRNFDVHELPPTPGSPDRGGTVIQVYDSQLLLVVQPPDASSSSRPSSRAPSRPPSTAADASIPVEKAIGRTPSIRVKPGSAQGLDRKTSINRRNSLPSISQRPNFVISEPSSERPLRVVVRAGTLERLIDILVFGLQSVSVSVADDNGEMALREGKTRDLFVDHDDFAHVWWRVYRSFVTPFVFFELLRKRYHTSHPIGRTLSTNELLQTVNIRCKVCDIIQEWIENGGGAQDALDNTQLFYAMQSLLDPNNLDHISDQASKSEDPAVIQALQALTVSRKSLATSFTSQTMRPSTRASLPAKSGAPRTPSKGRHFGKDPADVDNIDAEKLVDDLDAMLAAAFSNVSEEDLFVTSDLLEVQTADRLGWFLPRDPPSGSEDTDIQTMYSHLQEIEPSHMILELGQDAFHRLLPPGIRSCIRAYGILRKWLISKLVAFRLGLRVRQSRMDLYLRAIEIARLRGHEAVPNSSGVGQRPCIRSFVEAVLTSAIVSVESRLHHRAWQNVATSRGVQYDTVAALLSRPFTHGAVSGDILTVDMGWLLERMLEIISSPDVVTAHGEVEQSLVNFEKRRQLCDLIESVPFFAPHLRPRQRTDVDRRDFERLNNIEKEVSGFHFDLRGIKEEAHRENLQATGGGNSSAKKVQRPFHRLVLLQQEKNKRDKSLRDRLSKGLRNDNHPDKYEEHAGGAVHPRNMSKQQKQHRNKKSVSSAFFQFMRPISSAFTSDTPHGPVVKKTAAELDFVPSNKPALVLSVAEARVSQYINNERSFIFKLDTEDGGHYLLQALSKREMARWMDSINRAATSAAKRRLTYLGSPKPQLADHIHNYPMSSSSDPTAVFGVNIQDLLAREAGHGEVHPGTIPFVMHRCLAEIESRGLTEVGIYRIAGATSEINALKDGFNRGESPIGRSTDIHAVCDLVKSWFRVLPEPLFPTSSYFEVIEAMKLESLDARLSSIRGVIQTLPQANFDLLKRVTEHLDKVTDYEEHNQMTAEALAIVFSPNLLRAPQNDFAMILANMGHTHKLVKTLITHFHVVFDDGAEVDQEEEDDDFDGPIPEEDEEDDEDELSSAEDLTNQFMPSH